MAPLTDPTRLAAYNDALENWNFEGYVQFQLTEESHRWIRANLDGVTLKEFGRLMREHVVGGGAIDEVSETRPEWSVEYEYHYDLRFSIAGCSVYVETRLHYRLPLVPDEPWILVVNVHAP